MPTICLQQAPLAFPKTPRYSAAVAANSATGFSSPTNSRRPSVHVPKTDVFFVSGFSLYGGCVRDAFGRAGFLESRSINPRTAATQSCFAAGRGGSSTLGAVPMNHPAAVNPSASHAAAWKARAIAALHADSSLSVRLARYNAAMAKARALEVVGGAV